MIGPRSEGSGALSYGILKFLIGERWPLKLIELRNFIQKPMVDRAVFSQVIGAVQCIPQGRQVITQLVFKCYSFNGKKSFLLDPVHEIPWSLVGQCNFLDFFIKKLSFGLMYSCFILFSILKIVLHMVSLKAVHAFLILPLLGVFSDMLYLCMFCPSLAKYI